MYLGFEIEQFVPLNGYVQVERYVDQAKGRVEKLARYIIGTYNGHRVLDAESLSAEIFPEAQYDVFLSHSHADQRKAIDLAIALESRGLKVFVDSTVWGYFGDLVRMISTETRPSVGETKDQLIQRINADVHMMLVGALHRMISRAETFIFVRSEKSVPLTYGISGKTLSPWLFSELQFSFQVQHATPKRIRDRIEGRVLDSVKGFNNLSLESMQYLMAFKAFNDHLPPVCGDKLHEWFAQLPTGTKGSAVLDSLYSKFNLTIEYYRRRDSLSV